MRVFREQIEYIQRVGLIRAVDWLARVVVADGMGVVDDSFCPYGSEVVVRVKVNWWWSRGGEMLVEVVVEVVVDGGFICHRAIIRR